MDSDELIVRRVLDGHTGAFELLVDRYQTVLFNLALRILGDHDDARDVVQTAFMKAFQKLDSFCPEHRFFSWIYRIGMNESLNLRKRRRPMESIDGRIMDPARDPAAQFAEGGRRDTVQAALMQLTLDYRTVVVLRHFADLSYQEIGAMLGVPEKTVKSRLFTARRLLEEYLVRKGVAQQP
ncbi:MAG TPA: sigma-70 family RNA polymerase sigma factor [Candidatus Eisenbacteria bacterium]